MFYLIHKLLDRPNYRQGHDAMMRTLLPFRPFH
jgi:hypothetical protein